MQKTAKILTMMLWMTTTPLLAKSIPQESLAKSILHLDWRDKSISPSDDFYGYANGFWQKSNPIPPEQASWGVFKILHEKVQELLHEILITQANNKEALPGSIEQKVGDFYFSGMNEDLIEKEGLKPLIPEITRIESISNQKELQEAIIHLHNIGVDVLFGFESMQDFKDSTQIIGAAFQSGLGLPDRDYYLKQEEKFKNIRSAYVEHITQSLILSGSRPEMAAAEARDIMNIETALAKVSMSQIEKRDPQAIYHLMDIKQLNSINPNFDWTAYLKARGQDSNNSINLAMPNFFKGLDELLTQIPLNQWKTYLRWHLIDAFAPYLSKPFVEENFRMNQQLTGTEKMLPRWKRVVNAENNALGYALGKLYVEKHFNEQDKQAAMNVVLAIRKMLKKDLKTLSWMTEPTKKAALAKLALMEFRVGYPEKTRDYSTLEIDRGPYVLNVLRANAFLIKRDLHKIGKLLDKTEWSMPPQTVNAYYDPSRNNINLPAAILQPPFFDSKAPAAVNFGAIGFVIGHEITHGFDDQGAKFDGYGNLKNWWTPEDEKQFFKATQCIANQFSAYTIDNQHVQGDLVVGEATADLGGLTLAHRAFLASKNYKKQKTIEGMSPEQQFFLSSAHVWAMNIRPKQARLQLTTDPHPPAQYRVNGTLSNMPAFRLAFHVKPGSPMIHKKQCVIW